MHTYELQGYQWDARGWLLRAIPYTDPELLHPEDLIFPWASTTSACSTRPATRPFPRRCRKRAPTGSVISTGSPSASPIWSAKTPYQGTAQTWERGSGGAAVGEPPANVMQLLLPYRRHTIGMNQG